MLLATGSKSSSEISTTALTGYVSDTWLSIKSGLRGQAREIQIRLQTDSIQEMFGR